MPVDYDNDVHDEKTIESTHVRCEQKRYYTIKQKTYIPQSLDNRNLPLELEI